MKMNRRTCLKVLPLILVAALVLVGLWSPIGETAAGGSATVTLAHEGIVDGTQFILKLYKVGEWIHTDDPETGKPDAVLKLDDDLATAAKVRPVVAYSSENDPDAVLKSSKAVGDYIKGHSSDYTALDTKTITVGGEAVFSGLADNGLYIVTGDTAIVGKKRWTPISAYIDILNGEKTLSLNTKMESEPIIDEYTVTKAWNADPEYASKEEKARPKSIDVEIKYGDHLVDTVTLKGDSNWTYSWKVDESEPDEVKYKAADQDSWDASKTFDSTEIGDKKWHVFEVADEGNIRYVVDETIPNASVQDDGSTKGSYLIANNYDVTELEIKKNLDGYVDGGAASNITVAFKVTGKVNGAVAYENTVGLTFEKGDDLSKTAYINNVPSGITEIEVNEVYAAGYEAEKSVITKTKKDEDGVWRFEFNNTHGPGQGSGVINRYENGEYQEAGSPK